MLRACFDSDSGLVMMLIPSVIPAHSDGPIRGKDDRDSCVVGLGTSVRG